MKWKMVLCVLFSLVFCMFSACGGSDTKSQPKQEEEIVLTKELGKDYKILQLTDIQIVDNTTVDTSAFNLVKELVNETNPDLIYLTGDNVYGKSDIDGSSFTKLVTLMESFEIPWTFVNGNHDGEFVPPSGDLSGLAWQADYIKNNTEHCLFETGDTDMGYGNYTIKLKQDGKVLYQLIGMDTHGFGTLTAGIYSQQVEWYKNTVSSCKEDGVVVPSMLFMHIPLIQYKLAAIDIYGEELCTISTGEPLANGDFGANREAVCYFMNNTFWNEIKNSNSTVAIFSGHDHVNNSSIMYEGIRLTYGTKTGTYDYCDTSVQGGTLITISDDASFKVVPISK